jgi:hypothetical protein
MTRYFSILAAKTAGPYNRCGEHENGFGPETAEHYFNQRREVQTGQLSLVVKTVRNPKLNHYNHS